MNHEAKVNFWHLYRDTITGYEGTCTGVAFYPDGEPMVELTPTLDKDGNVRAAKWFGQGRLKEINEDMRSFGIGRIR